MKSDGAHRGPDPGNMQCPLLLLNSVYLLASKCPCGLSLTTFRNVPFNAPFYASAGFRIWDPAPAEIEVLLTNEAARGLKDRCAMVLEL